MNINQWLQDNPLVEHDLLQGTDEWASFRLEHDGASEAAVMLGISDLATRTELLDAKSIGISKEFSEWVQEHILDNGHRVEAMARPIIEKKLGIKLYPVVYSRGRPSASCDGITMAGNIGWEHKQWNQKLAEAVAAGNLPDKYMAQPQQCMLLTGAEKWIFTVSDGTEENMVSMEVYPDSEWFARILLGWEQFNKDRETHVPKVIAEKPKAEVTIDLPALFVHAKGEITTHNMDEFGTALTARLAEVRAIALVNDQDFSNAKEAAKKFRETAKAIAMSKEQMLAQTETIGEAARKMDAWAKDLNATALQLEKDVEREDKAKKEAIVNAAALEFRAHVEALEAETRPIQLNVQRPNFSEAIKGKRNYASMQDAVDTMLANAKIGADAVAKDVRAKLSWCKENAAGHSALFTDLQNLMSKPLEDFTLTITSRIDKHKADEAAKMEAVRIQAEADARAKIEAEQNAKQVSVAAVRSSEVAQEAPALSKEPAGAASMPGGSSATGTKGIVLTDRAAQPANRPSDDKIIEALALHFRVHESKVIEWLLDMDLNEACERMAKEFA